MHRLIAQKHVSTNKLIYMFDKDHEPLFFSMVTLKVLISIILLGMACGYVDEKRASEAATNLPIIVKPKVTQDDINIGTKTPTKQINEILQDSRKPPSKENLESRSRTSSQGDEAMIVGEMCLNRSQSFSENLSQIVEELRPELTDGISPKSLFANSTVSLASVSLNEDYTLKDAHEDRTGSSDQFDLRQRKKEDKKVNRPQKPLSEVDRFSMVSNRIV